MKSIGLIYVALVMASPAAAVQCSEIEHAGSDFTICEVDAATEDLRLFLRDSTGSPLNSFGALEEFLEGDRLAFAMNAGMFHDDFSPVGHYIERGVEGMRVITNPGPGNFGLLPNGVFCIGDGVARVFETLEYVDLGPDCRFATQSGPMLVIDGALHPRFIEDGTSRKIRNGVGTSEDGRRVVFAIADERVNFHDFGTLFRDVLGIPDALFLDGSVSRLHAPGLGRSDRGAAMGPILGVIE